MEEDDNHEKQDNEEDAQLEKQKLKSALHYYVGEIATNHASSLDFGIGSLTIDKHAIAALAEMTYDFAGEFGIFIKM